MSRLVLPRALLEEIRTKLLASEKEACALLFGRTAKQEGRVVRLVVREAVFPEDTEYEVRSEIAARLKPTFLAMHAQRARRSGESLVFVHSHPFPLNRFSPVDDAGEDVLSGFLKERTPNVLHAAMLVTPEVTIARVLGEGTALQVMGAGPKLFFGDPFPVLNGEVGDSFDRQIRMFGKQGQARLKTLRVGIIGLGGTGSLVAQQLAHLGVENFFFLDPDTVETSNLNRLVGARRADVGSSKVEVARRSVLEINPQAKVETCEQSALLAPVAARLLDTDLAFGCTDSQGSRSVLNQLSYQFLLPMIDMGVSIVSKGGTVSHMAGRVNMLSPGLGCFVCGQLLNPEAVRVDLLTEFERAADPYIVGAREPAPAVISLNSTAASMAVTMFMDAVLGIGAGPRFINYDAVSGSARPAAVTPHPNCYVCSPKGAFAQAGAWPLPGRLK